MDPLIAPTKIVLLLSYLRPSRGTRKRGAVFTAALFGLFVLSVPAPPIATERARAFGVSLQTAVDTSPSSGSYERLTLTHIRATGATFMRLGINWSDVAPVEPPPGFDAANPNEPAYNWAPVDRMVIDAVAYGLTPFLTIVSAPTWGQAPAGADNPDPNQLALFARAIASRYDGSRPGLPWVRYLEVWNEPNSTFFLKPQIVGNQVVSVNTYRTIINDFAAAVHDVRSDDVVIAGSLFPNGLRRTTATAIAPLQFTRQLLCLSAGPHPRRVCDTQVHADAWSVHPYTTGGPSTRPANPDNVWIQNLGSLTVLVRAAQSLGTLVSSQPVQTWVTEFSWDSNPPNPKGVPVMLQQRWVAETLYRAWRAGYSVFTWNALRDEPITDSSSPSGLYFACPQDISCDTPKPAEQAFRFPFVAYTSHRRRVLIWGRTPSGTQGVVQIQWLQGRRWQTLTKLRTDGDGIFTAARSLPRGASPGSTLLRAVLDGPEASPPFSLHRPPDIIVTPFGS
jgi:hypothetical protein